MKKERLEEQLIIDGVEAPVFSDAENLQSEKQNETVDSEKFETETGVQLSFDTDVDLGLDKDYVDEKLKEAMETQAPKTKKKNNIISVCLLAINIVFMTFIIKGLIANVGDANISNIIEMQGAKLWWLVGGVGIYVLYMLSQMLMYLVLIKDLTGKTRVKLAYDVAVTGKYYDNVTPVAVGGQPMQIVRLSQNGVSPGVSTSIPIIKLLVNSIVNMVLAVLFFAFGLPHLPHTSALNDMLLLILEVLGVIGLVVTVFATLFMVLISSGSLVTRSTISFFIRLGYKLKIVKNYRLTLKKVVNQVSEYKTSMSYLWKKKKLLFKMIGLAVVECLTYAVMPYFVVQAFMTEVSTVAPMMFLFVCLVKYYICAMSSSYIPLPGGTGLIEIAFIFLFGMVVNDNIVWALLAWRFLSYYLILIHGFIHELSKIIKGFCNARKIKRC